MTRRDLLASTPPALVVPAPWMLSNDPLRAFARCLMQSMIERALADMLGRPAPSAEAWPDLRPIVVVPPREAPQRVAGLVVRDAPVIVLDNPLGLPRPRPWGRSPAAEVLDGLRSTRAHWPATEEPENGRH